MHCCNRRHKKMFSAERNKKVKQSYFDRGGKMCLDFCLCYTLFLYSSLSPCYTKAMSITEWKASLTPRLELYTDTFNTSLTNAKETRLGERHLCQRRFRIFLCLRFLRVERDTWQQGDGIVSKRLTTRAAVLAKWNNWGCLWGKLLYVNFFFFDKQDKLLHVSGLFFFPQDELYAAEPVGKSECSGLGAAVSHPEERLDRLPDKAVHTHAGPKTVTRRSTQRLWDPHPRPSNIPAIVGIFAFGFLY